MKTVRIGAGAGFSGDRIEPAIELVEHGQVDYLAFECLAERTIALAQAARQNDPDLGYDPWLEERMSAVLAPAFARGVRIVSNMGAANPAAAARAVTAIARRFGLSGLKTAAVTGDDVLDLIRSQELPLIDRPGTTTDLGERILSANAYLGAAPIAQALARGAHVVITGRVGDPALFLGPLMHEFGWAEDDWVRLGRGTLVGHLLECAGQLTGGYFADPGVKDVPDLARLGFPFAEVDEEGNAVLGKVAGSGGRISVATCTEQLLYEILDPSSYLQADVVADFSDVRFSQLEIDRVAVSGAFGRARPDMLKVSLGYQDGFIGEGQISYAGPGAVERGRLALAIVKERLSRLGEDILDLRLELIGLDSIDGNANGNPPRREVRVRVAASMRSHESAVLVGREVEALYTNGPAGGGGASQCAKPVIAVLSTLIDRSEVKPGLHWETAG